MKILKIIHGYPPLYNAGSEVYSQSLCSELLAQGQEVLLFTREEDPYRPDFTFRFEQESEQLQFCWVNMPRDKDGYIHYEIDQAFAQLLNEQQPDIAHVGHLNHLSTGLVWALQAAKIPIVFTLHDFWLMCPRGQFLQRNYDGKQTYALCHQQEDRKCATSCYRMFFSGQSDFLESDEAYWSSWIGRRMQETRAIAQATDLFIAPSRYLRQRFIQDFQIPEQKIIYLDYGFPTHYLKASEKTAKNKATFTFGYIGTHIPAKGVNLLIEAFKGLNGRARLKIWGWKDEQSQKALQQMLLDSALDIEFCGSYLNENLAQEVFAQVDAIVVPSIWGENSPLVIHEAQACRIPIITANYGGMAEYVRHQVNGLLFKHRSMPALRQQMQWALEHLQKLNALGQRGYLYHPKGEVPSIRQHCQQLLQLYAQTIQHYESASTLAHND